MRKLTIKRKRSLIECASKITLLVQCDKDSATHNIKGVYYKSYEFKNGKTLELEIPDNAVIIGVKSSTMQRFYTIEEGSGDVFLIASPRYSHMEGNPFTITRVDSI